MFELYELQVIRQALDVITIAGKDAKLVATIQHKVEFAIEEEKKKAEELQQVIKSKSK
jgi:hypothetical protein